MKINPGTLPRKIWKYNGTYIFLLFLNTDQNAPKKKFRIETWTFSFQICFENQFSTCVYVYFQFDHFPKLKINF